MSQIPFTHILFVSTCLFFIGAYGLFTRRNMITMLMSVELMLNSVNINFVTFNKYLYPENWMAFSSAFSSSLLLQLKQLLPSPSLLICIGVIIPLMWKMQAT